MQHMSTLSRKEFKNGKLNLKPRTLGIDVGIDGRQRVGIDRCVGRWDSFDSWGGGMGGIVSPLIIL